MTFTGRVDWSIGPKLLVGSVADPDTSGVGAMTWPRRLELRRGRVGTARHRVDVGLGRRRHGGDEDRRQGDGGKGGGP